MNRLAFAVAAVAALSACPAQTSSPTSSPASDLVLKAYDVPAEQASELEGIIDGLLYVAKDAPRKGSAALTPSGQLLVAAPASFQPGIADVIAKMKSAPPKPAPTVHIDYWIVTAEASNEPTKGNDVAKEVGAVLDDLEKNQGPMKLTLLERLSLSSQTGSDAGVEGNAFRVHQDAALHGDKVVAKFDIRGQHVEGSMNARVELPIGQTVVLGQAGVNLLSLAPKDAGKTTAFYIGTASVDAK